MYDKYIVPECELPGLHTWSDLYLPTYLRPTRPFMGYLKTVSSNFLFSSSYRCNYDAQVNDKSISQPIIIGSTPRAYQGVPVDICTAPIRRLKVCRTKK